MYLATKILIFVIVLCEGTLLIEAGKLLMGAKKIKIEKYKKCNKWPTT
jgi:hypothetical protein